MTIIVIDPGEHIGVVYNKGDGVIHGITFQGDQRNLQIWNLLNELKPTEVIYELFALRPGMGNHLAGNKFITCEVIGVIKLYCQLNNIKEQYLLPAVKEYCGFTPNPKDENYKIIVLDSAERITEHVRDAYRLYSYYKLFGARFK